MSRNPLKAHALVLVFFVDVPCRFFGSRILITDPFLAEYNGHVKPSFNTSTCPQQKLNECWANVESENSVCRWRPFKRFQHRSKTLRNLLLETEN